MTKKENKNILPGKPESPQMSPKFEEAARVLSNLAVENIFLTKNELLKRLSEDFKDLKPEEVESLTVLFSRKEEGNG